MEKYRAFKREKVLEFEDEKIIAANAGVLTGQLAQITSGEIYRKDLLTKAVTGTEELHDEKLKALDDLIEAANGNPVLVFYYFQHEKERILNHIRNARALSTTEDIRDWNAGRIDVLNLQAGGHIAIWYSLPNWNLELYQQANARIYRQGQAEAVTIYQIIAAGTIDEDQEEALKRKDVTQQALIRALRR